MERNILQINITGTTMKIFSTSALVILVCEGIFQIISPDNNYYCYIAALNLALVSLCFIIFSFTYMYPYLRNHFILIQKLNTSDIALNYFEKILLQFIAFLYFMNSFSNESIQVKMPLFGIFILICLFGYINFIVVPKQHNELMTLISQCEESIHNIKKNTNKEK